MAPRKKQQQQPKQKQNNRKSNSTPSTSDARPSSSGPKLNISAENETRLRRLLLSSARSTPSVTPADDSLSKVQKVKKLKAVYEKLSCEGFTNDQIELALSAIGDGATFEAALDWLCLNLPSSELPLKFSSGTSLHTHVGGSVRILQTAQKHCPSMGVQSSKDEDGDRDVPVILSRRKDDDKLDRFQSSQAEWIKQYVEQQEEPREAENSFLTKIASLGIHQVVSERPILGWMVDRRGGIPAVGDNREQEEVEEITTLSPRTSTVCLLAVEDSLGDLHVKFDRVMDSLETLTRRMDGLPAQARIEANDRVDRNRGGRRARRNFRNLPDQRNDQRRRLLDNSLRYNNDDSEENYEAWQDVQDYDSSRGDEQENIWNDNGEF
ncbi:DExH-box ATP-dependent RNA helicase DExH7 [Cucumis melo var. makuwa]|uniref:DExH-box ATP-dependent RNA helicase DExH7 n=1 Tax=Cucumis melo var. makuwa TaxID=1194695 RepID=A0A5D3CLX2_CUCMM|nr:DExH-box ATP-dependent RNA helicase DExH7 [Cucumis melo var. makuwa]